MFQMFQCKEKTSTADREWHYPKVTQQWYGFHNRYKFNQIRYTLCECNQIPTGKFFGCVFFLLKVFAFIKIKGFKRLLFPFENE